MLVFFICRVFPWILRGNKLKMTNLVLCNSPSIGGSWILGDREYSSSLSGELWDDRLHGTIEWYGYQRAFSHTKFIQDAWDNENISTLWFLRMCILRKCSMVQDVWPRNNVVAPRFFLVSLFQKVLLWENPSHILLIGWIPIFSFVCICLVKSKVVWSWHWARTYVAWHILEIVLIHANVNGLSLAYIVKTIDIFYHFGLFHVDSLF